MKAKTQVVRRRKVPREHGRRRPGNSPPPCGSLRIDRENLVGDPGRARPIAHLPRNWRGRSATGALRAYAYGQPRRGSRALLPIGADSPLQRRGRSPDDGEGRTPATRSRGRRPRLPLLPLPDAQRRELEDYLRAARVEGPSRNFCGAHGRARQFIKPSPYAGYDETIGCRNNNCGTGLGRMLDDLRRRLRARLVQRSRRLHRKLPEGQCRLPCADGPPGNVR